MKILNANAENIIRKSILWYGKDVEFMRPIANDYGETEDRFEMTVTQKCIYHMSSGYYVDSKQSDEGKTAGEKSEMLLTDKNDNIKVGDYCTVGDGFYRVYAVYNYDKGDKFIEISIEVIGNELNR